MTAKRVRSQIGTACLVAVMAVSAGVVFAQTRIKPGFNLFSVDQDQEIGRQSAEEAERQLPILRDRSVEAYVNAIGKRLAAVAPGAKYAYQFKVVNASDINAFALPGGYMYLNRGLIEAAGSEGQLAGVMAHEMAHVALRHGTNQASKAYLGQAGLGILGGLLSKDKSSTEKTIGAVGGFGLNAMFLKFSRTAEEQADVTGAQMLAKAGYDPMDMVTFFEMLRDKNAREPSKVEQFFSSHPAPANRAARVTQEMKMLKVSPTKIVGGFRQVKAELQGMPAARSTQQIVQGQTKTPETQKPSGSAGRVAGMRIERPSREFRVFDQRGGFFQMGYPDNWRIHEPNQGYGVTIAPEGGFVETGGDERSLIYGVIVNHYEPFDGETSDRFSRGAGFVASSGGPVDGRTSLARATNDLVSQIQRTNPDLRMVPDSTRRDTIDGAPALSLVLSGQSLVTREEERVTVFTRELPDDHVIYALFIAPGQDYDALKETFNRMISSLRVSDETSHR